MANRPGAFLRSGWTKAKGVLASATDALWSSSRSAFRGAEYNRLSADRWTAVNHPDTEIQYAARPLRARARDLVRNDAYAAGAVEAFADNVIGWEGIRCKPSVTAKDGTVDRETNWAIESAWREWGDRYATADGVESWLETERLIVKSWVTDGEVFVRRRKGFDNPHGFAVELIDPDMLDEDFNEKRERNGREIVMGVEVDPYGRPVAYHFWKHHPDEMGRRERVRIPADEITHHFVRYRPGQTRGYSLFAPILTTAEMIGGALEAELVASRTAASKMGFITNDSDEAKAAYALRLQTQNQDGKAWQPKRSKVAPGVLDELVPGQGFVGFDPTHPNTAFDQFLKLMHRGVARGLGMSYLTLTGDVSAANYSSMRAGLLPERDHWKALQVIISRRVHGSVYRDWLGMALLSGALDLPGVSASEYAAVEWRGRRWQWVDPKNDLEAAEMEVKLGVNSRQRLASDRGIDYEVVVDEIAEDLAYAKTAGVYVGGLNQPTKPNAPASDKAAPEADPAAEPMMGRYRPVLFDAAERVLKHELDKFRAAIKKGNVEAWADGFYYQDLAGFAAKRFLPACLAIDPANGARLAGNMAADWASESLAEVRRAVKGGADLTAIATRWETDRVAEWVRVVVQDSGERMAENAARPLVIHNHPTAVTVHSGEVNVSPAAVTIAPAVVNVTTPPVNVTTPAVTVTNKIEAPKRVARTMTVKDPAGKVVRVLTDNGEA